MDIDIPDKSQALGMLIADIGYIGYCILDYLKKIILFKDI